MLLLLLLSVCLTSLFFWRSLRSRKSPKEESLEISGENILRIQPTVSKGKKEGKGSRLV